MRVLGSAPVEHSQGDLCLAACLLDHGVEKAIVATRALLRQRLRTAPRFALPLAIQRLVNSLPRAAHSSADVGHRKFQFLPQVAYDGHLPLKQWLASVRHGADAE